MTNATVRTTRIYMLYNSSYFFLARRPFFFFRFATRLRQCLENREEREKEKNVISYILIMLNFSVISYFLSYFCRTRADRFIMKIIIAFSISLLSFSSFSNMRSSCLNKLFFKQNENDVYDERVSKWHKKILKIIIFCLRD